MLDTAFLFWKFRVHSKSSGLLRGEEEVKPAVVESLLIHRNRYFPRQCQFICIVEAALGSSELMIVKYKSR